MGIVDKTAATLRFSGDTLDPDEITAALGAEPTRGYRKGDPWSTPNGLPCPPRRTGGWNLRAPDAEPGDLDGQIQALLLPLSQDLHAWRTLAERFNGEFYTGLFVTTKYLGGIGLSQKTMAQLSERGLSIDLDIFGLRRRA